MKWLREKALQWLGLEVTELAERFNRFEAESARSSELKAIRERLTALETATKSATAEPAEKKTQSAAGGWSTLKRSLQKDAEWPH